MKFLMAFMVVAIHTTVSNPLHVKDLAVPFFYIASGFFLFGKLGSGTPEEGDAYLLKWLLRTARLYVIWTLVFLPFTVYGFISNGTPFAKAVAIFFRNIIFVGENYLSWPLWYLLGMLWAGGIIFILRKLKVPVWGMLLIGIALMLVAQLSDLGSVSLYHHIFNNTRNGIFVGFPYMMAGGLAARFDVSRISPVVWLVAFLIIFVCSTYVAWLIPLAAVALFLFAASVKDIGFVTDP